MIRKWCQKGTACGVQCRGSVSDVCIVLLSVLNDDDYDDDDNDDVKLNAEYLHNCTLMFYLTSLKVTQFLLAPFTRWNIVFF